MEKLLSKKTVREYCLYSSAHIDRLEKAGKFPLRVKLSANRVGWVASEIEEWIQTHIADR
jgi:prophage regulatory protein